MFEYRPDKLSEARERNSLARECRLWSGPLTSIKLPIGEAVAPLDECGIAPDQAIRALAYLHDDSLGTTPAVIAAIHARPTVGTVLANRRYCRTAWPLATGADDQED